jgi:hypothetical protein
MTRTAAARIRRSGPDSGITAGSEVGPENPLKEETAHLLLTPTRRVREGRNSSSAGCGRREPCLHILATVSDMASNSMRARTFTYPALRIQRLHSYLKVSRHFDRRGQTSHPGRRPARLVLYGPCIVSAREFLRADNSSDRGVHHGFGRMGTSIVGKLSREQTTREARTGAVICVVTTNSTPPRTTAGHIWSEREPVRRKPASTCSFAAPGVGLEPTTYGLTVRRSAD